MLQGNFYTVLEDQSKEESRNVRLEINADHDIFEGHFPKIPVVPGVCMMQMVKELVEGYSGKKLRLVKAEHLKFLTIIDPRQNKLIEANLVIVPATIHGFHVTATFFHKDITFFKFKGGFEVE